MDDKRYIQSLINEGEHQQQDFKYRVSDAMKLAKSVSAFANTDGGRLRTSWLHLFILLSGENLKSHKAP